MYIYLFSLVIQLMETSLLNLVNFARYVLNLNWLMTSLTDCQHLWLTWFYSILVMVCPISCRFRTMWRTWSSRKPLKQTQSSIFKWRFRCNNRRSFLKIPHRKKKKKKIWSCGIRIPSPGFRFWEASSFRF